MCLVWLGMYSSVYSVETFINFVSVSKDCIHTVDLTQDCIPTVDLTQDCIPTVDLTQDLANKKNLFIF